MRLVPARVHFVIVHVAHHTWHGAGHNRDSCCCQGPQSNTERQNLASSLLSNNVTTRYLSQHVAKEKARLDQARHCGTPAKVFSHRNNCDTDVDFVLQSSIA